MNTEFHNFNKNNIIVDIPKDKSSIYWIFHHENDVNVTKISRSSGRMCNHFSVLHIQICLVLNSGLIRNWVHTREKEVMDSLVNKSYWWIHSTTFPRQNNISLSGKTTEIGICLSEQRQTGCEVPNLIFFISLAPKLPKVSSISWSKFTPRCQ